MVKSSNQNHKADWSIRVGFMFVLLLTISSICLIVNWVVRLDVPKPLMVLLTILSVFIWICGLTFLYHAERKIFSK